MPIDEVPDRNTSHKTTNDRQRKCFRGQPKSNATNEHDSFETLAQNGDEWQQKHCIFLAPELESVPIG